MDAVIAWIIEAIVGFLGGFGMHLGIGADRSEESENKESAEKES